MKRRFMAVTVAFLILLVTCPLQSYAKTLSETVTYRWKKDVEVHDSSIPIEISIPTVLTVDGLPDRSQPGKSITVKVSNELVEGAQIKVAEEVFGIDEALESSLKYVEDVDLSSVEPLLDKVLARIISVELGLDEEKAEEMSSILIDYTHFTLKSRFEVETNVEGNAAAEPRTLQLWFDEPKKGIIRISDAADGDIQLTYTAYWSIVLSIDFTENVYENPLVGPLISRLSKLIGLPFERDLGRIQGEPSITHKITIYALPRLTGTQIAMIVALVAAACIVALILVVKHPKKPKWA